MTRGMPGLLLAAALALPAAAQQDCGAVNAHAVSVNTVVAHRAGGTDHNNPSGLTVLRSTGSDDYETDLHIGTAANWTASVAIGSAGRCAGDADPTRRWVWFRDATARYGWNGRWEGTARPLVSHHIADRSYDPGTPIARKCTYKADDDGRGEFTPHRGLFTVRIHGKLCHTNGTYCVDFRPGGADGSAHRDCRQYNRAGYTATFAPGPRCGPPQWPTRALREAAARGQLEEDAALGYAEWCDFTVTVP